MHLYYQPSRTQADLRRSFLTNSQARRMGIDREPPSSSYSFEPAVRATPAVQPEVRRSPGAYQRRVTKITSLAVGGLIRLDQERLGQWLESLDDDRLRRIDQFIRERNSRELLNWLRRA